MLASISQKWAQIELFCAACLAFMVSILILINVVTRTLGMAIYWVDELAIYTMVWMTFLGTSSALHYGHSISVTILKDVLPPLFQRISAKLVDLIVFIFAICMIWFCWRWFMPWDLLQAGFSIEAFQAETFNFVYAEPTTTLGVPKYLVWMIMALFSVGAFLHSLNNLLDFSDPKGCSQ